MTQKPTVAPTVTGARAVRSLSATLISWFDVRIACDMANCALFTPSNAFTFPRALNVFVRASLRRGTESWEMSAKLVECILVTSKETVV